MTELVIFILYSMTEVVKSIVERVCPLQKSIALDLPLKVLVWQSADDQV